VSNIITAGYLIGKVFKERGFKKVYIIGREKEKEILRDQGIEVVDEMEGNSHLVKDICKSNLDQVKFHDNVEAIMISTTFHFDFMKMFHALTYFKRGAKFFCCKRDHVGHFGTGDNKVDHKKICFGGGSYTAALELAC